MGKKKVEFEFKASIWTDDHPKRLYHIDADLYIDDKMLVFSDWYKLNLLDFSDEEIKNEITEKLAQALNDVLDTLKKYKLPIPDKLGKDLDKTIEKESETLFMILERKIKLREEKEEDSHYVKLGPPLIEGELDT